jgi:secondary thiamine-phosphate synthase enzyme
VIDGNSMRITIHTTRAKQVIDISDEIEKVCRKHDWKDGAVLLFVTHTTCALTTADLDPGTDQDLLDALEKMFPKGNYRHPHDPSHVGDHIMSSIIGASLMVPIEDGKLELGTWQRIVLVELSGPRERTVIIRHVLAH